MHSLTDLRPLGQIHNSFIIAAGKDGLWIIDQHVAHERILFEKVLKQRQSGASGDCSSLLMPVVLQLTAAQQLQYARIADELNATGFETEPFGNRTIAVKAAPAGVGPAEIEKILFEILEIAESELRSLSLDDIRRRHRRIHRLPGGHQGQHETRSDQDGVAADRACQQRITR